MNDNIQGAGEGVNPQNTQQSQSQGSQGGYDSVRQSSDESQNDMGGGDGTHGSGVAGGYEGNSQNQNQNDNQGGTQEKQDWLDKGISSVGQKFGINIVSYLSGSDLSSEDIDSSVDRTNQMLTRRVTSSTKKPRND